MSEWSSTKAKRVLAALLRIGWEVKRISGSHRILSHKLLWIYPQSAKDFSLYLRLKAESQYFFNFSVYSQQV
jgi:HicA toxin of bacterial toxin-antitoxin,